MLSASQLIHIQTAQIQVRFSSSHHSPTSNPFQRFETNLPVLTWSQKHLPQHCTPNFTQYHNSDKTTNYYNGNNRGSSSCCHTLANNIVVSDRKSESMAGAYICAGDDGWIIEPNGFVGIKILKVNLLLAVTGRQKNPAPGVLTQEVSRSSNRDHIATSMMQSFISPSEIVSEMNTVDRCQHRTLTPGSRYTCIGAVLKLVNELDKDVVFGVAVAITNTNNAPDTNIVDFLLNQPPVLLPPVTSTIKPPSINCTTSNRNPKRQPTH